MASNDTYDGALEVLSKQVSTMMGLVDANLPFCVELLKLITEERRSPQRALERAGLVPPGGPEDPMGTGQPMPDAGAGLPMDDGMGMSAPPAAFMGAGGGVPGMAATPPSNPDELRRVLMQGAR